MRGFVRVLRAEAKKLVRRRVGYLALGIGLIAAVSTVGLVGVQAKVLALQGEKAQQALNGFEVLSDAIEHGLGAAAMPLLVLAGFLLSEELELGTAKILYSKPVRRLEVVLAKGALLLGCAFVIAVLVAAVAALYIHLRIGFHNVVSAIADPDFPYVHHTIGPEACPTDGLTYCMPRHALLAFGLTLVPLGALLLLGLMLSACTHQSGASVGLAIGAVLCMLAVGSVVPRVEPYLVTTWFFYPEDTLHQLAQGLSVEGFLHRKALPVVKRGLWVSSLTGLAAWAIAALVTWRRQILLVLGLLLPALLLGQRASARSLDVRITQHRVHGHVWGIGTLDVVTLRDKAIDIAVDRVEGGGTIPLAYLWGDFTGDKRSDLLTLDKQDIVSVYPMQLTGGELDFPESGRRELRVRTSNSSKIQDINWDGKHDLVFWYWDPNWEHVETGVFTVVMSK